MVNIDCVFWFSGQICFKWGLKLMGRVFFFIHTGSYLKFSSHFTRPTQHQLKLEPDEREEEKGISLCTVYAPIKGDLFISHCLQSLYEKIRMYSQCLCSVNCSIFTPGVCCVHTYTVLYSPWLSAKKTGTLSHLTGLEISERHIFIIWSSLRKWLEIFCSCAWRQQPQAGTWLEKSI